MIFELFIINTIILDIIVLYFVVGKRIEKFVNRRIQQQKCHQ